jgi:hypothetical protein
VAEFPIGDQVQDNIHGLRGSGVGLVIGLVAFAWGARGLTQVAQHAMAEIWNIPGRQRPGFWARQVPEFRSRCAHGRRNWDAELGEQGSYACVACAHAGRADMAGFSQAAGW